LKDYTGNLNTQLVKVVQIWKGISKEV